MSDQPQPATCAEFSGCYCCRGKGKVGLTRPDGSVWRIIDCPACHGAGFERRDCWDTQPQRAS